MPTTAAADPIALRARRHAELVRAHRALCGVASETRVVADDLDATLALRRRDKM